MTATVRKQIIVTDLDGSLLDEQYRWEQAGPAIERLRHLGFPLVLNSSKTLAEIHAIAAALRTDAPLVAENGGIIAIPETSPLAAGCGTEESALGYRLHIPGLSRASILRVAHDLRQTRGYAFEGFADWSLETIIEHTGLSRQQALDSSRRCATEPILWRGSEENLESFSAELAKHGVRMLRGGRFIHLMGSCDKAGGLRRVLELYRKTFPGTIWSSIALGDGPNDLEMLNAADTAVVIPNLHDGPLLKPTAPEVFNASLPGPAGWNEAISRLVP